MRVLCAGDGGAVLQGTDIKNVLPVEGACMFLQRRLVMGDLENVSSLICIE